jgi:ribosomal protein L17
MSNVETTQIKERNLHNFVAKLETMIQAGYSVDLKTIRNHAVSFQATLVRNTSQGSVKDEEVKAEVTKAEAVVEKAESKTTQTKSTKTPKSKAEDGKVSPISTDVKVGEKP